MLEREGTRQAENIAESILIYASGAYLIVVALAIGLWLYSRLERPKGLATTERGNLLLLMVIPVLVFMLMPGLPVIYPVVTVVSLLILALIAGLVARSALRFVSRNA